MQASDIMDNRLHKKPPPTEEDEEDVPEGFVPLVRQTLAANKTKNNLSGWKRGHPKRLISNQSELADAVGTDKNNIRSLLGPVKPTDEPFELSARSRFVRRIYDVLDIKPQVQILVDPARAEAIRIIALLPEKAWRAFADEAERLRNEVVSRQSGSH